MKTIAEVSNDIAELYERMQEKNNAALSNRWKELKTIHAYLLMSPSEEFIRSQLDSVRLKMSKILECGPKREDYKYEPGFKKDLANHKINSGYDLLRKQEKLLLYILY